MILLYHFAVLLIVAFAALGVETGAAKMSLSDEEKIKRIMSLTEKAKAPRNFYRWQSETSGNNLLQAGEYNEKLFTYFMTMEVDKDHFAGGRGVYYAEDITSSAQFIRGDGKGSLIEVRIPKGMPTLDLTNSETLRKLEKLGVTTEDVLFLDPPIAVRYSSNGWWAVKRRDGVKFQPFNPSRVSTHELIRSAELIASYPRASEVLAPHVAAKVNAAVTKDVSLLTTNLGWLNYVSRETLMGAIGKSPPLQQLIKDKFVAGKLDDLPAKHFGVIVTAVRNSGVAIDETPLFKKLSPQQKIAYLDEIYPEHSASIELVRALLSDREIKDVPFKLSPSELLQVERHILPALSLNPDLLIEYRKAHHLLSSENFVSLLRKNDSLRTHFAETIASRGFEMPLTRNAGQVIADFKAAEVRVDEEALFQKMPLYQRLQYLDHSFQSEIPPAKIIDELVSAEGLRYLSLSSLNSDSLRKTLSRFASIDGSFLARSPNTFQYVEPKVLQKVVVENEAVRTALFDSMNAGKFSGIDEKPLKQLSATLSAAGQAVSNEALFKNLSLDSKLAFLQQNFTKKNLQVPATFIRTLIADDTIQRNGQIGDRTAAKLEIYINDALAAFPDDLDLLQRASRLYSFEKIKVDGRALVGYESRTPEAKSALGQYASAYLRHVNMYDSKTESTRTQVFNSLVGGRFSHWDYSLYEKLNQWHGLDDRLTPDNKLILEEELVKILTDRNVRDTAKIERLLSSFVKSPSEQTANALYAKCKSVYGGYAACRTAGSIYETSALRVLESSPEAYVEEMKGCLESKSCWSLRALFNAKPPEGLTQNQVSELMKAYKAAPLKGQLELNAQMIEIASRYWSKFPDDYLALFNPFPSGMYPSLPRTDEARVRRAAAIQMVGETLTRDLKPENISLARAISRELFMDIAHERDSKKVDYDRLSKLKMTSQKLHSRTYELEQLAKKAPPVGAHPATHLTSPGLEPAPTMPQETKAAPDSPAPTETKTASVSPAPTAKNECATLFQKLGQFLKRRGR